MRAMHYRGWIRLNSVNCYSLSKAPCINYFAIGLFVNSNKMGETLYDFNQIYVFIQIWCTSDIHSFDYIVSVAWKSLQRDTFLATDKSGRDWYWLVVTLFLLAYYQLLSVKQAYTGITILPLCKGSFHISKQSFLTIFETMILFFFFSTQQ